MSWHLGYLFKINGGKMIAFEQSIKLETEGRSELILFQCSRQPDSIRISRHNCVHRYLLSQKKDPKTLNNEFGMALQARLEICRTCIEGYMRSIALKKKSPFYRKDLRSSLQIMVCSLQRSKERKNNNSVI